MQRIFCDYGIEIFIKDEKYYIRYDAGEIVEHVDEIEVSKEDAQRAQISEDDAYRVILENQNL